MSDNTTLRLRLYNQQLRKQELILEPWGDIYNLAPGDVAVATKKGTSIELEIELTDSRIILYGATGDVIEVDIVSNTNA